MANETSITLKEVDAGGGRGPAVGLSMSPLVFLDCETLGLDITDPIWEVAAIRREPDGTETRHHWHVGGEFGQPVTPAPGFPEWFRADFDRRYGVDQPIEPWPYVASQLELLFRDRPHVVGAVPNFDTERIAHQFGVDGWHYHLIDVENLAVGYLSGRGEPLPPLPWNSDDLSRAVGVDPDRFRRHEAMADAEWARAIYDRVMGAA